MKHWRQKLFVARAKNRLQMRDVQNRVKTSFYRFPNSPTQRNMWILLPSQGVDNRCTSNSPMISVQKPA